MGNASRKTNRSSEERGRESWRRLGTRRTAAPWVLITTRPRITLPQRRHQLQRRPRARLRSRHQHILPVTTKPRSKQQNQLQKLRKKNPRQVWQIRAQILLLTLQRSQFLLTSQSLLRAPNSSNHNHHLPPTSSNSKPTCQAPLTSPAPWHSHHLPISHHHLPTSQPDTAGDRDVKKTGGSERASAKQGSPAQPPQIRASQCPGTAHRGPKQGPRWRGYQRTSDPRAEPQEQAHRDHLQQLDEAREAWEARNVMANNLFMYYHQFWHISLVLCTCKPGVRRKTIPQ